MDINKKCIKKNLIIGLIIFLAVSGLWIVIINSKYDKLTIGTTTEYNHAITGPEYAKHPVYFMGLIKPPNKSATSTWEEPSLVKLSEWSAFESMEYFKYQLILISENLFRLTIFPEYYSILSIAIIIISLYYIFKSKTNRSLKNDYFIF